MTTISAEIIADSRSPDDIRLTTLALRYPRAIHSEFMTHRVFSRNAASSRAIPVSRLIQDVIDDPFVPLHWGKNQKGMQAREQHDAPVGFTLYGADLPSGAVIREPKSVDRESAWLHGRNEAVSVARAFAEAGYHKQVVNRLLEPFAHINVVVSATDWANFIHLRDHEDAEPHIAILARKVAFALDASTPKLLEPGDWHLPYADRDEDREAAIDHLMAELSLSESTRPAFNEPPMKDLLIDVLRKLSVARCASVSYKTVDGQPMTAARAIELHDKLVVAKPLHASPAEHQATPDVQSWRHTADDSDLVWANASQHGNFRGWRQYRKTLPGEAVFG